MAQDKVAFELVSPERLLRSQAVEMVVVPGVEGDFGVLPGHMSLISTLRPGVIRIYEKNQVVEQLFVAGGFAEVTGLGCTVLADMAVAVDEIDLSAVERQLEEASAELAEAATDAARAVAEKRAAVARAMLAARAN